MISSNSRFLGIDGVEVSLLKHGDIDEIVEMLENPNVCRYLFFAPAPKEIYKGYFEPIAMEMKSSLDRGELPKNMVFILRDAQSKEFLGQCGVIAVPMIEGVYEVGYQFREEHWGKGLATKASKLCINYIFNYLSGHRAEANCYETNMASRRVLEKCWFRHEGYFRGYYRKDSGYIGRANYGLLRDDMKERSLEELKEQFTLEG